eukprot:Sdes_comp15981_c0_seq1m5138
MARILHHRKPPLLQKRLHLARIHPLLLPLNPAPLQMPHRGKRPRHNHRGQRGREYKPRRIAAYHIHHQLRGRYITPNHPKRLPQRPADDVHVMHHVHLLGDACAGGPVHADRVDFIEKCKGPVLFGQGADVADGGNGARHGVDGFKGDDFGGERIGRLQQRLEMAQIVVAEDALFRAAVADPLDHRCVVHLVRIKYTVGERARERAERRIVGHKAGRKHQRRRFLVQISQLLLKPLVKRSVPRNVARPARARSVHFECFLDGFHHFWMPTHPQIIVAAPNSHLFALPTRRVRVGVRVVVRQPVDVFKHAVAFILLLFLDLGIKVLHVLPQIPPCPAFLLLAPAFGTATRKRLPGSHVRLPIRRWGGGELSFGNRASNFLESRTNVEHFIRGNPLHGFHVALDEAFVLFGAFELASFWRRRFGQFRLLERRAFVIFNLNSNRLARGRIRPRLGDFGLFGEAGHVGRCMQRARC